MLLVALEQRKLSQKEFVELFSRKKTNSSENPRVQVYPPYMTLTLKKRNPDEGYCQRWNIRYPGPEQEKPQF